MAKAKVMRSFSTDFLSHVRLLYQLALRQMATGKVAVDGINGYTDYAAPAYITSVASLEAYLNEIIFGPMTSVYWRQAAIRHFDQEWIGRLDIRSKLMLVPQLLFDSTFDRGGQPYQDFALLVSVRNEFVHYKMRSTPPKYLKTLEDRSIAIRSPDPEQGDYLWVEKLSTCEGIRWAHNTSCRVVQHLAKMIPEQYRELIAGLAGSFIEIDASQAQKLVYLRESKMRHVHDLKTS